jgi:hypothetical protein
MSIPKPEGIYGLIWTGTKIDLMQQKSLKKNKKYEKIMLFTIKIKHKGGRNNA